MRITIATGVYPPDIGGPAEYSRQLFDTFLIQDHTVDVVSFSGLKKYFSGLRHLVYFFRLAFSSYDTDYIIAMDTFSTGLPAVLFAFLFRKKIVIRVGGDFLWESYVNRTKEDILLSQFYLKKRNLNFKEKVIFSLTKFVFGTASAVVFNTAWQREIIKVPYDLSSQKTFVVENAYFPVEFSENNDQEKIFFSPTRESFVKNKKRLEEAFNLVKEKFDDIVLDTKTVTHQVMIEKIAKSYAVLATSLSDVSPNLVSYALQYAVPVIITEDTGMKDRIKDMVIFVNPVSKEDIAKAIEEILDPATYAGLKENILKNTYRHSWNEIAQEFLDIYKKI